MIEVLNTFSTLDTVVFGLVLAGVAAGVGLERLYAGMGRSAKRGHHRWRNARTRGWQGSVPARITDSAEQLRIVTEATFTTKALLNKQEAQVLYAAERAVAESGFRWRVMAQVNLGEILKSENRLAFAAINSKRVDLLIISSSGNPLAAIEYQGGGHYQNTAPLRDAVKKEALRKAGVRYIEFTGEHNEDDVRREIARLASDERRKDSPGART